jgi:hypothetical protein
MSNDMSLNACIPSAILNESFVGFSRIFLTLVNSSFCMFFLAVEQSTGFSALEQFQLLKSG